MNDSEARPPVNLTFGDLAIVQTMITLLIFLVIVGVCLYLVETYIPMSPPIKVIIRVVVVLLLVLYLLRAFGFHDLPLR